MLFIFVKLAVRFVFCILIQKFHSPGLTKVIGQGGAGHPPFVLAFFGFQGRGRTVVIFAGKSGKGAQFEPVGDLDGGVDRGLDRVIAIVVILGRAAQIAAAKGQAVPGLTKKTRANCPAEP